MYSAARYASDAGAAIRDIARARAPADSRRRHRLLLPRARARAVSRARRATTRCARGSIAWPPGAASRRCIAGSRASIRASAPRIQPRDRKRLVRALEVYLADRPAADRHTSTRRRRRSPDFDVLTLGLQLPRPSCCARVSARGSTSSSRAASSTKCERSLAAACPPTRMRFSGLVYRQVMEMLRGVRDEPATRDAHRSREHALRAPPVDLVPQGAWRTTGSTAPGESAATQRAGAANCVGRHA